MKTESGKKETAKAVKTEIKSDGPLSEKDEVKKAEEKMRQAQPKVKGK